MALKFTRVDIHISVLFFPLSRSAVEAKWWIPHCFILHKLYATSCTKSVDNLGIKIFKLVAYPMIIVIRMSMLRLQTYKLDMQFEGKTWDSIENGKID